MKHHHLFIPQRPHEFREFVVESVERDVLAAEDVAAEVVRVAYVYYCDFGCAGRWGRGLLLEEEGVELGSGYAGEGGYCICGHFARGLVSRKCRWVDW